MKKYAMLVLLLFSPGVAIAADNDTGRFLIVSGVAETIMSTAKVGAADKSPMILKIDTQTGATWALARIFADGEYREGWTPLGNLPPPAKTPKNR